MRCNHVACCADERFHEFPPRRKRHDADHHPFTTLPVWSLSQSFFTPRNFSQPLTMNPKAVFSCPQPDHVCRYQKLKTRWHQSSDRFSPRLSSTKLPRRDNHHLTFAMRSPALCHVVARSKERPNLRSEIHSLAARAILTTNIC